METYIRLTPQATELLNHYSITPKGQAIGGAYFIRHSEDIHFREHHEYSYTAFAKKLGIHLPTKRELAEWAQLTDDNCHTEALLAIAKWAEKNSPRQDYKYYVLALQEFIKIHEVFNCCTYANARYVIHNALLEKIQSEFGPTIYRQLYACL